MVFHKDPCGIFCIILTYGLVLYADYVVMQHVLSTTLAGRVTLSYYKLFLLLSLLNEKQSLKFAVNLLIAKPVSSFHGLVFSLLVEFSVNACLWGPLHAILFNMVVFALLFAHTKAVFSDPGTVPLPRMGLDFSDIHMQKNLNHNDQMLNGEDWTICQRCETYRPPRAHHCKVCKRCIRRMDHHCPWVNNCIGEMNQKYFIQFLFYTGMLCIYALILNIANWIWLFGQGRTTNADLLSKKSTVAHGIGLCIESILFGLFVIVMLVDQVSSIVGDETAVEYTIHKSKKQKPPKPRRPKMALLREVFGYGPIYSWFLPCTSASSSVRSVAPGSYDV